MQNIQSIELNRKTREELLPGFSKEFPYIATCAKLDQYDVPWHWHKAVELFYMEKGCLEYETPEGKTMFSEGSGGIVLPNVLHTTRIAPHFKCATQKLHIFDTAFISGQPGGRIEQTYFLPLTADPAFEILMFSPEIPEQAEILRLICDTFLLNEQDVGYEISLQKSLLDIWLLIYQMYQSSEPKSHRGSRNVSAAKCMMLYVREHFAETITVKELAEAAHLSERECYRVFRESLHTTPMHFVISCRLQEACRMLSKDFASVTEIALDCGFGSGSYFSRVFSREMGCTPNEYRVFWQNRTKNSK